MACVARLRAALVLLLLTVPAYGGDLAVRRALHAASVVVETIGRGPGLPDLPDALFTSIAGVPGDSGAPLVDGGARIVGLVHGGVRCHIATPSGALARLVDRVLERDLVEMTRSPAIGPHRPGF